MNYTAAKTPTDIKLEGITVSFDRTDNSLRGVYLRDAKGNHCRFIIDSYNFKAEVPAPPKKEKRYIVRAELPVIGKVEKAFEEKYEADDAKCDLEKVADGEVTVSSEEVEVEKADAIDTAVPF